MKYLTKNLLSLVLMFSWSGIVFANSDCCSSECDTTSCDACECEVSARSFFSVRPQYQLGMPERITQFHHPLRLKDDDQASSALKVTVFGGQSNKESRLATYFTPFCKSVLKVRETNSLGDDTDIRAEEFNVVTATGEFESDISFCPQQSVVGVGFTWRKALGCVNDDGKRKWWIEASMPITHVRNKLNFYETIINDGGGVSTETRVGTTPIPFVANMKEAFAQDAWKCGKIGGTCTALEASSCYTDCCDSICSDDACCSSCDNDCTVDFTIETDCDGNVVLTKTRPADIDLLVGYTWVDKEDYKIDLYGGVLIPTGTRPTAAQIFEPIVGHNKHWGISFGGVSCVQLCNNEEKDSSLWWYTQFNCLYLVRDDQKRLIDLKNKPWSRYMQVYANAEQAQQAETDEDIYLHTPGVNVFCRDVRVSPGVQKTITSALMYTYCGYEGELGYSFFCRPSECVELCCPWVEGPAFKAFGGVPGQTDRVQQINDRFQLRNVDTLDDYNNNIIKATDLDLTSAAHPCMATHTFYGSIARRYDDWCYPTSFGIGGGYEFGKNNTAMNRWTLWATMAVSF
ncbi:MAG: hypothetical protein WBQ73_02720 [Candidatus Babeliales bacterium]